MRIQKSCGDKEVKPEFPSPRAIKPGTIFRYDNLTSGPYLGLTRGFVDLTLNNFYPDESLPIKFSAYLELKDAYLVTGEK